MIGLLLAALLSLERGGIALELDASSWVIDPARSVIVSVKVKAPMGKSVHLPDFRSRVEGFSLAEDFEQDPVSHADGSMTFAAEWKLVPEPCAERYRIKPFVVGDQWFGPVNFELPPPREPVTGEMEVSPSRDLPRLSWRLVGWIALVLVALALLGYVVYFGMRYLVRRVKEHRMSPIERAWVELDRLLRRGLPGRGRYKDYYVELTMVVRRYVQRRYGIRAPHLTTEEFLQELAQNGSMSKSELQAFLESSDMVKFAGVEATPEMADMAASSAREYLKTDSRRTVVEAQ